MKFINQLTKKLLNPGNKNLYKQILILEVNFKNMHFIITGGAGFIGSYLTEKLLSEGHKVTVVDNLITGNLNNLHDDQHNLKIITKNILDCHPLDFNYPIDGIAHLAATPSVSESWEKLMETHDNNLSTTIAVIQLCQKLNIPRLVFASSAAVYGTKITLPISENQPLQPISPYGLQKLFSEQYTSLLAQKIGFSFVSLRLFNVFGYRQLPTSPYSGVISILLAAMQENKPIVIYGDGTQTRDFIYVKDVAIALPLCLSVPLSAWPARA